MAKSDKGRIGGSIQTGGTVHTGGGDYVGGDKVAGDKVGRDKVVITQTNLQNTLAPIADAIEAAAPDRLVAAKEKLDKLKQEVAKGTGASDSVVAKLIEDIVKLVPAAVQAVVAAFGGVAVR